MLLQADSEPRSGPFLLSLLRLSGGEAGFLTVSENQDCERKSSLIHYRVILARNGPARSRTQPDCLERGWEGFGPCCGCSWGSRAQEHRSEGTTEGVASPGTASPYRQSAWLEQQTLRGGSVYLPSWGFPEPSVASPRPAGRAFRSLSLPSGLDSSGPGIAEVRQLLPVVLAPSSGHGERKETLGDRSAEVGELGGCPRGH